MGDESSRKRQDQFFQSATMKLQAGTRNAVTQQPAHELDW
jgi:hypothetical protein